MPGEGIEPSPGVTPRGDFKSRASPAACNELQRIVVDSTGLVSRRLQSVVDLCLRNGAKTGQQSARYGSPGEAGQAGAPRKRSIAHEDQPSPTKPDLGYPAVPVANRRQRRRAEVDGPGPSKPTTEIEQLFAGSTARSRAFQTLVFLPSCYAATRCVFHHLCRPRFGASGA
jgi:hypothetical protein